MDYTRSTVSLANGCVTRSQDKLLRQQQIRSSSRVTKRTTITRHTKKRATPIRHINIAQKYRDVDTGAASAATPSKLANESSIPATSHRPRSAAVARFLAESDLMSEHTVDDTIGLGDLDNVIHPIFRRENFPKPEPSTTMCWNLRCDWRAKS